MINKLTNQQTLLYFYKLSEVNGSDQEQVNMKKAKRLHRNFVGTITPRLKCPICYDVFFKPRRLFCGHTFCKPCLQQLCSKQHNKNPEYVPTCPLCRTVIQPTIIGYDYTAKKIIDNLQVTCPTFACPWQGKCSELEQHYHQCPLRAIVQEQQDEVQQVLPINDNQRQNPVVLSVLSEDQSIEEQQLQMPQRISADQYFQREINVQVHKISVASRGIQTQTIPVEPNPYVVPKRTRRRKRHRNTANSQKSILSIKSRNSALKLQQGRPQSRNDELQEIQEMYDLMGFDFYEQYDETTKKIKPLVVNVDLKRQLLTQRW